MNTVGNVSLDSWQQQNRRQVTAAFCFVCERVVQKKNVEFSDSLRMRMGSRMSGHDSYTVHLRQEERLGRRWALTDDTRITRRARMRTRFVTEVNLYFKPSVCNVRPPGCMFSTRKHV
jgi:hypothetical protein